MGFNSQSATSEQQVRIQAIMRFIGIFAILLVVANVQGRGKGDGVASFIRKYIKTGVKVEGADPEDQFVNAILKAYNTANPDAKMSRADLMDRLEEMAKNGAIVIKTRPGKKRGNTITWVELTKKGMKTTQIQAKDLKKDLATSKDNKEQGKTDIKTGGKTNDEDPEGQVVNAILKAYNADNPDAKLIRDETKMMGKNGAMVIKTRPGRKTGTITSVQLTGPKDHYADVILNAYNAANPDAKMIITEANMKGKNGKIVIRTIPFL